MFPVVTAALVLTLVQYVKPCCLLPSIVKCCVHFGRLDTSSLGGLGLCELLGPFQNFGNSVGGFLLGVFDILQSVLAMGMHYMLDNNGTLLFHFVNVGLERRGISLQTI